MYALDGHPTYFNFKILTVRPFFPDYLSVSYDYGLMFFSADNKTKFKKQNNFCSKLYKKEQNNFFSDLELNKITDNKLLLKA